MKMDYMKLLGLRSPDEVWHHLPQWMSDLSDYERKARSTILDAHAAIEGLFKHIVYEKLSELLCIGHNDTEEAHETRKKKLRKAVRSLQFGVLYRLLKPALDAFDSEQFEPISSIQEARNSLAHKNGHVIYKGKNPCSDPECLAQLFVEACVAMQQLDKFIDHRIEGPRAERREYAALRRQHPTKAAPETPNGQS